MPQSSDHGRQKIMFYDVVLKEIDRYVAKTAGTGAETARKTRSLKQKSPEAPSGWGYLLKRVAIVGGVVIAVGLLLHYLAVVQEMEEMQGRIQALEERPISGRGARPATARMVLMPDPSGGLMVQVLPGLPEPEPEEGALVPYRAPGLPVQRPPLALMDGVVQEPAPLQAAAPLNAQPVIVQVPAALADAVEAAAAAGQASDDESNDSGSDFDDYLRVTRRQARADRRVQRAKDQELDRQARVCREIFNQVKEARLRIRQEEGAQPITHGRQPEPGGVLGFGKAVWGGVVSAKRWMSDTLDGALVSSIKQQMRPVVYQQPKADRKRIRRYVNEMNRAELERYARYLGSELRLVTPEMVAHTRGIREGRYRATQWFLDIAGQKDALYGEYWESGSRDGPAGWATRAYDFKEVCLAEEIDATAHFIVSQALGRPIPDRIDRRWVRPLGA